jgi:peptidoglycan/xylan/chitin deacetylase (PgdA/CDA1 family)
MEWLKKNVRVVPLAQTRSADTDARVCLTFDDALANIAQNALPVLRELNFPATVFAVSGNLGANPRWDMPAGDPDSFEPVMSAADLQAMGDLFEIGSHTHTHSRLSELAEDQALRELCESKRILEGLLGYPVTSLSLPYGDEPEHAARLAAAAGYETMVSCARRVTTPDSNPLRLGRFAATPDDWDIEFRLKVAGAYAWLGFWRDQPGRRPRHHRITRRVPAGAELVAATHGS